MYLIRNNHEGIVTRETFNAVQTELARRNAGVSPSKKTAPTGKSCYASKYALSERLVCGECGTLYRRCTWSRNGQKKVVWRCVSRLDYGTKYCKESPSMEERPLQLAIMAAINSAMSPKEELVQQITDALIQEVITVPDSSFTLGEIKRRLGALEAEFGELLDQAQNGNPEEYMSRFQAIKDEMTSLKEQREKISDQLRKNLQAQEHIRKARMALDQANQHMTEWNEETIRQLVHTVKVISSDQIRVHLYDGVEIEQEIIKYE